jgi:shikimate dehydrogenase
MNLTASTKVAAVIGSPVRHSLSPIIHNAAFNASGVDWVYVALEVDVQHAAGAIDAMRVLGLSGLSVTMPHKEVVLDALDEVDDRARLLGAVNTVTRAADGRLVGFNTDGLGCRDALVRAGADLSSVAVVGAGATARAVVAALAAEGSRVCVANRSPERRAEAVRIGNVVRPGSTDTIDIADVAACKTIVNTTPLGMAGVAPDAVPLDASSLNSSHWVLDAVYHPLHTRLLDAARRQGSVAIDGLEMLCAQAARQQEIWLGHRPDVSLMRSAALESLSVAER